MTAPAPIPRLTVLDEAVLGCLPARQEPGVRAERVHLLLTAWHPALKASRFDVDTVLRGFEHLGMAHERRGWWTR